MSGRVVEAIEGKLESLCLAKECRELEEVRKNVESWRRYLD